MALERDMELMDSYLSGKLSESERLSFENRLASDPELKGELEFQQQLVSGLKTARIAELKAMMNAVPVPSVHGTETAAVASKIALWTVVAGLVATGIYFIVSDNDAKVKTGTPTEITEPKGQEPNPEPEKQADQTESTVEKSDKEQEPMVVSEEKSALEHKALKSPESPTQKTEPASKEPAVFDPTDSEEELTVEFEESKAPTLSKTPSVAVEIVGGDKKYDFHYQFSDDKLVLYGPFEKNVYEIMEFISDEKRTMFLYYQDKFYLLKDETAVLKPLGAIHDKALIRKLREYRKN